MTNRCTDEIRFGQQPDHDWDDPIWGGWNNWERQYDLLNRQIRSRVCQPMLDWSTGYDERLWAGVTSVVYWATMEQTQ
ncbi:hypothetical protein LCGC14_0769580 [marine sediment metagenome]|uniref:Uncharacterized protein n=1 Tax=marine sediment metagenome TaxID=412755 RepID=A0A0F9SIU5_9ZZZZ